MADEFVLPPVVVAAPARVIPGRVISLRPTAAPTGPPRQSVVYTPPNRRRDAPRTVILSTRPDRPRRPVLLVVSAPRAPATTLPIVTWTRFEPDPDLMPRPLVLTSPQRWLGGVSMTLLPRTDFSAIGPTERPDSGDTTRPVGSLARPTSGSTSRPAMGSIPRPDTGTT